MGLRMTETSPRAQTAESPRLSPQMNKLCVCVCVCVYVVVICDSKLLSMAKITVMTMNTYIYPLLQNSTIRKDGEQRSSHRTARPLEKEPVGAFRLLAFFLLLN